MEPITQRLGTPAGIPLVTLAILGAGCRLGPLVDDQPGASANVLPSTAMIPTVDSNPDLTNQIVLNDGLDTNTIQANNNTIVRGLTGIAGDGTSVKFWAFGDADRAPSPIYVFGRGDPTSSSPTVFVPLADHPSLVEVVPGDADYEPIHTVFNVAVTEKYAGQKITTVGALSDAIDLGLVLPPVGIKVFVNSPIVRPGLKLEVGTGTQVLPTPLYAHGYVVDSFPLGGKTGRQPNPRGLLPTSQVTFVREAGKPDVDLAHPIFQASLPPGPPGPPGPTAMPNYTPLCQIVKVDLVGGKTVADVHKDGDLFVRSASGDIMNTNAGMGLVAQFTITNQLTDLQMQFMEGAQ